MDTIKFYCKTVLHLIFFVFRRYLIPNNICMGFLNCQRSFFGSCNLLFPRLIVFVALLFVGTDLLAQSDQYIIKLTDKSGSPYSLSSPESFLSRRAIERRERQNISITETDLPVNPKYIDSIRNAGDVKVLNVSKWLNQIYIETTDAGALQKINTFQFVKSSNPAKRLKNSRRIRPHYPEEENLQYWYRSKGAAEPQLSYGDAADQILIHKGNYLHDKGFKGQDMLISVIDDGFFHYRSLPAFDSLRLNHRIVDTFDFVDLKLDMNMEDTHGMHCLSILASNVPGQMIGSAPAASYLLYRSEDVHFEFRGEEQNWIAAAERSDSIGADVISTSLGYNLFDNPDFDYTYNDMNGKASVMSKAAAIAASKGMILVVAAGNEGNNSWHFITIPADAENILTVGAVDKDGAPGKFSSYGPTVDGRIKPDVVSVGVGTYYQSANGSFASGNGTSYATPNLAGLVACLWQAFPDFSANEIMDVVRKSSDRFPNATDQLGYGIPDFEKAFNTLSEIRLNRKYEKILGDKTATVFPNPLKDVANMVVRVSRDGQAILNWYDEAGRLCFSQSENLKAGMPNIISLKRNHLASGTYTLKLFAEKETFTQRILIR